MNNMMASMSEGFNKKFIERLFRPVEGVVWDLMTGRVGVQMEGGIATIEGTGDLAQVTLNVMDQFGLALPAFAQATPKDAVKVGDLIYGEKKVKGWVIEIKEIPVDGAADKTVVKRLVLMTPDGQRTTWTPPNIAMLGFESGVMVLRSLANMLPGGDGGLGQMQSLLMPMMMMGGSDLDLESMMPMLLFSQMGGMPGMNATNPGAASPANNPMAQMMPMMLMMGMMKGKGGKSFF